MILALTGGTGFVGGHVIARAAAAGHHVRALARREQAPRDDVTWIAGTLGDQDALARLTEHADAVIHVAGAVNARDRAGFAAANIDGTRAMLDAAGGRRFVHVSSLAAREPALSNYGWSKAESEALVAASGLGWDVVRPPAVYGPGDMDLREMFRMAKLGLALLPPPGRMAAIHGDDLARLLLALAEAPATRTTYEPDDGGGGITHDAFARAIGVAVGRRVLPLPLPRALLSLAARADRLVRGNGARLTADRVAYMSHPDWTADPAKAPPPALWRPAIPLADGLAATARWYRANGLL